MLKRGAVVEWKDEFWYVRVTNKTHAIISKITPKGIVSTKEQKVSKKIKTIKVECKILIKIDFRVKEDLYGLKYKQVIQNARRLIYKLLVDYNIKDANYLCQMALDSCKIPSKNGFHTLKDFIDGIRLKKPKLLYVRLSNYLIIKNAGRKDIVHSIKDTTLQKIISHYDTYWSCWHGFDKNLDKLLEEDYSIYRAELTRRIENNISIS